jgi:ferredoxin
MDLTIAALACHLRIPIQEVAIKEVQPPICHRHSGLGSGNRLTETGTRVSICSQAPLRPSGYLMMKILVDLKLCEGNERCAAAAPGLFLVRDDQADVLIENPLPELMGKVGLAIRLCPRQAISRREK